MSEGALIEIRNSVGDIKELPQGPELEYHLLHRWAPTDPDVRIVITGTDENGELNTDTIYARDYSEAWSASNGRISIQNMETSRDISTTNDEISRQRGQEEIFRSGFARTVNVGSNFAEALTFGVSSELTRQMSPEAARILEETAARDPLGSLAGQALGIGASLFLGGQGALAGAGALTARAGQVGRGAASAALTARGIDTTSRGARVALSLADNLAQAGTAGVAFNVQDAIARNRPLVGERILADAGIDLALGLGFDAAWNAAVGAGGQILRRVRNVARRNGTGREIVHGGRLDQLEEAGRFGVDPRSFEEGTGIFHPLQEIAVGGHGERIARSARHNADLPQALRRVDGVHSENLSSGLTNIQRLGREATEETNGLATRLNSFTDEFRAADNNLELIQETAGGAFAQARRGWETATRGARSTPGVRIWNRVRQNLDRSEEIIASASTSREVYEELANLKDTIKTDFEDALKQHSKANKKEQQFFTDLRRNLFGEENLVAGATRERFRGVLNDERLWGNRVVRSEATYGALVSDMIRGSDLLEKNITSRAIELGAGERVFSPRALSQALKKIGKGESQDLLRAIQDHVNRVAEGSRQISDLYGGIDGTILKSLQEEAEKTLKHLAEADFDVKLVRDNEVLLATETRMGQAGHLSGAGAAVGAFLAGPLGAVGGFLGGLMVSHILRPGSSYRRLGEARDMFRRARERVTGAQGKIRSSLKSRLRLPKASVRRAIPPTVFLLRGERDSEEQFRQMRDALGRITPESLADNIAESTLAMRQDDPELADEMAMTMIRAHQYLAMSIPTPGSAGMLADPIPSKVEMDAFIEKYLGIQDPISMLEDFAEGRLTQEKAQAVLAVYPQMHAEMVNDVVEVFSEFPPENISYQYKSQLSLLLNVPADSTFTSQFVMAMQNVGAQTTQQSMSVSSVTPGGINNLSIVTGPLTENQRVFENSNL